MSHILTTRNLSGYASFGLHDARILCQIAHKDENNLPLRELRESEEWRWKKRAAVLPLLCKSVFRLTLLFFSILFQEKDFFFEVQRMLDDLKLRMEILDVDNYREVEELLCEICGDERQPCISEPLS